MWIHLLSIFSAALVVSVIAVLVANLVMVQRGIEYKISEVPSLDSLEFLRLIDGLIGLRLCPGNHLRLLLNGQESFPAMFQAVEQAERTITFENYVYWSGKIGRRFAELLARKAGEGTEVRVVLDWVGSLSMDSESLKKMEAAGVEVHRYHRPRLGGMHRLNHRTHRRELVIDGRVAFTGGVGFGDHWSGDGVSEDNWRDNHYEIRGPIVSGVQAVFVDNWLKTSGDVLTGEGYFPSLETSGKQHAAIMSSSPTERTTGGRLLLLMLVAAAKTSIRIEQAYFLPDRHLREALIEAAARGVDIEILVPGDEIDYPIVRHASRAVWKSMLQARIRIYEYQPTMLHVKLMVVDDEWLVAGSANFDFRSLYRNDEIYLVARDKDFAAEHIQHFEKDKKYAVQITLDAWRARPFHQKLIGWSASLLRTQL